LRQSGLFLELMRGVFALPLLLAAACATADSTPQGPCTADDEVPTVDLVEAALLSSPLHTVAPCARIVGHMARFRIDTRWGPLAADSIALLHIRVAELSAIEELEHASHAGLAARAAGDSANRIADSVDSVITRPLETLQELPAGALRFFQRKLEHFATTARETSERTGERITGADETYDRVSIRPGVVLPDAASDPWWQRGSGRLWRAGKNRIGYGDTRRTWAQRLGIDPYSSNPPLNARMDSLAWAALAGDKAVGLATAQLGDAATSALGATRRINRMVWELPPTEVRRRNQQRLAALGCGDAEHRRFLRNNRFTPTLQTALVDALVALQPARGCVDVIELAAAVSLELEARYLVDALGLLAAQDVRDANLQLIGTAPVLIHTPAAIADAAPMPEDLRMRRREPGALERLAATLPATPQLILPLAVDRLQWDADTAAFFDQPGFVVVDKRVLIAGTATHNALQGLTRRGWEIVEEAQVAVD
jgi:hypothetical protein